MMTSLRSKWAAGKARGGRISKSIRNRQATQPPAHFQRNPLGRGRSAVLLARPVSIQIWALRSRLEKQPTDLRRCHHYMRDGALGDFCRLSAAIAAILLLCDCRRQSATPSPTPSPTPSNTATETPSPPATLTPTPAPTPLPSPSQPVEPSSFPTASPSPSPTATPSPIAEATPTPSPDPFQANLQRLLQASENGFRDLRGKLKKTEKGSGPEPLFRIRKIYEGTFLFDGSSSAELEEVYFHADQQPAYNYRVFFQALSARESIERYEQFQLNLNHTLKEFEHTFGDRYDAWASHDALKTAVLLDDSDISGSLEIQVHVAFSTPQW